MKNVRQTIQLLAFFAVIILISSCSSKVTEPNPDSNSFAFEKDSKEYAKILATRSTTNDKEKFEIKEIKKEGDKLQIVVTGGCNINNYKVVWNGVILESYPAMINLVVVFQQSSEIECMAILDHTLELDLKKTLGEWYNPKDYHIIVSNGSKVADKLVDPDGNVSDTKKQ